MKYSKKSYRKTWTEISLSALRFNFKSLKIFLQNDVDVMAIVKANAYGHGIVEASKEFARMGVAYLGVASVDEALMIRKAIKDIPILVLGPVMPTAFHAAIKNNITITLSSDNQYRDLVKCAARMKKKVRVHIITDTGMGRLGIWHEDILPYILKWIQSDNILIEGIYTHFAQAAHNSEYTRYQLNAFLALKKSLSDLGITFRYYHAANSVATLGFRGTHFNLIRPGIMLYGIYPKASFRRRLPLKPVLSLKTKIVFLKDVPKGRSISYGRTYTTNRATKIATLPIGYADGYGRILSNRAKAIVLGSLAPVVGVVTMDQTMIDVGHIPEAKIGTTVTLIGADKNQTMSAEKLSRMAGTIPYEILCSISNRVPRIYSK